MAALEEAPIMGKHQEIAVKITISIDEAIDFAQFIAGVTLDRLQPFTWHLPQGDNAIMIGRCLIVFAKLADALEERGYPAIRQRNS
jgi:hypothetical protein